MVERELGITWSVKNFSAVGEGVVRSAEPVIDVVVARTFDLYARRRNTHSIDGYIPISMMSGCGR